MIRRGPLNANFVSRAEAVMPGCCLASMYLPPTRRVVIESAEGVRMKDADGTEYLDFALGSGPMLLGHAHPRIVEAVVNQVPRGSSYFVMNTGAVELAEQLLEAIPCGEALRFQTTGSDATFAALRIARAATGRSKVLQFEGGYHGGHDTGQLIAVSGNPPNYPEPAATSAGIPDSAAQDVLVAPFNDIGTTRRIVEQHSGEIAAILVEPLHRVFPPRDDFLEELRQLATKHGAVLVFDEVVTGFRLAWGGGQERYGVIPDLACYGKAIGGGYPLSAVVGSRALLNFADPERKGEAPLCFVGGTFTGNPVACAAGLATLDVLRAPDTYERLYSLAAALSDGLIRLARKNGVAAHVLGEGPICQVVFKDGAKPSNHAELRLADHKKAMNFAFALIDRGIFVNPGGKFYLSLAHEQRDIDEALRAADTAFSFLS